MIDARTFKGGIHPHEKSGGKAVTGSMPVINALPPIQVAIQLGQNVGVPCQPLVKAGDRVLMGQKIGEPEGYVGAPIHASVSGKVVGVLHRVNAAGMLTQAIVIDNDGLDEWSPDAKPQNPDQMDAAALIAAIRDAGIVGLGGAGFPTAVKLAPPKDKHIDTVILNGAECEPYITGDQRMMIEHPDKVVDGLLIAQKILSAERAVIAIEANKPEAISAIERAAQGKSIDVVRLQVKYPQGGEKQLIQVVTGRQVPSGKLPMDIGCVVVNVTTAHAVSECLRSGKPLIKRTITVTGEIDKPQNLRVRIGESIERLIDQCGGLREGVNKVILGGPMMGQSAYTMDTPVVKGTSGILMMTDKSNPNAPMNNCIRCARCARACPIRLMPMTLHALSQRGRFDEAKQLHAMDCIECGSCSYTCPAKLPLVQSIRVAKREIAKTIKR